MLNWLIIHLSQMTAFLFRHLINASLQNTETHRSRLLYHQLKTSCPASPPPSRRAQSQKRREEPRLIWPRGSKRLFAIILIFEILFYLSYSTAIWVLISPSNKELALTTARNLNTIHKPIGMIDEINSLYNDFGDGLDKHLYSNLTIQCRSRLVEFLAGRYEKFYVWNSSAGFKDYPLLNDFYLVEQSKALQLYTAEVLLFCHTMGSLLIICGVLGSLATIRFTYDVAPLLFIYDPTYCAFRLKAKLQHYLTDVRVSFLNYWSIFSLNEDYSLCRRGVQLLSESVDVEPVDGLDDNSASHDERLRQIDQVYFQAKAKLTEMAGIEARRSLDSHTTRFKRGQQLIHAKRHPSSQTALFEDHKAEALDPDSVVSLQRQQYVDFIPDSRSQSFRRVLMIQWPGFVFFVSTFLSLILISLFVLFVQLNSGAVELNRELREFLNGSPSAEPDQLKQVAREHCAGAAQVIELARRSLVSHLSAALLAINQTGVNSSQGQVDEDSQRQMVVKALAPTWQPGLINWMRPFMGATLTGTLCTLYYTIVFCVLGDLCFWLFGLRMKLNICRIVLKYYTEIQSEQSELTRECGSLRNWSQEERVRYKQSLEPPRDGSWVLSRATITPPTLKCLQEESVRRHQSQQHPDETASGALMDGGGRLNLSHYQHPKPGQAVAGKHELIMDQTDDILMNSSWKLEDDSHMLARVARVSNSTTPTTYLNLGCCQVLVYIISNRADRNQMCRSFAKRLIIADHLHETHTRRAKWYHSENHLSANINSLNRINQQQRLSDAFLVSAYLEFRLFIDQIASCRHSINIITGYSIFHAINIIVSSLVTNYARSRYGFLFVGYALANLTLISASFFQSQCTKLMPPIYSILASSLRVNESLRHLAVLWQRSLHDLVGQRSKFCFKVFSVRISYALALQFNFGITSLYILAMDRFKARI